MKNLLFMLGIAACATATADTQNDASFIKGPSQSQVMGISPNGKYAVGISTASQTQWGLDAINGFKSFLWTIGPNTTEWVATQDGDDYDTYGRFTDVNDDGVIVGTVKNKNMMKTINDWGDVSTLPLNSAAIWKNGKVTALGAGTYTADDFENFNDGSFANAISNDSKTVVGYVAKGNEAWLYPCAWVSDDTGNYKYVSYKLPDEATSGAINDVSADGKIAVGWYKRRYNDMPYTVACYWTSPETCIPIIDPDFLEYNGAAYSVSEDGNYIAFTLDETSPALYSVADGSYKKIGKHDEVKGLLIGGVTDDGDIFGVYKYGNYFTQQYNRPFWYSRSNDMLMDYDYFVKLWAENTEMPYTFKYESKENLAFAAVSADGKVFAGNGTSNGWILSTDAADMPLPHTVANLKAMLKSKGVICLSFNTPENLDSRYTVEKYVIYRDGSEIGSISANSVEGNTAEYIDNNVATGSHLYSASVVVTDKESGKSIESPRSETVSIFMESTFEMPLYDSFNSGSTDTNYWTIVKEYGETDYQNWGCPIYTGLQSTPSLVTTVDQLIPYSFYIKSRHIDATNMKTVYASFCNTWGYVNSKDWDLTQDFIDFEISTDDVTWTPVRTASIADLGKDAWTYEYFDLTPWAAGKMFSVRFRVHGEAKAMYQYKVDDFMIAEKPLGKTPENVLGGTDEEGNFHVAWKNSLGAYPLTYMQNPYYDCYNLAVGDEGNTFIAANLFTKKDLEMYKGKYLTSVTTLVNHDEGLADSKDTKASIVVYEDDKLVREQEINVVYNTDLVVKLDEPLLIDGTKDIKIGMKIYDYDERQMPIAYHNTYDFVAGKSDLYSQDGGATWKKLSDFYSTVQDHELDGYAAWEITGNVTDLANVDVPTTIDINQFAAEVYKNGSKYSDSFIFLTQSGFIDKNSIEGDTYQVRQYYADGSCSELSEGVKNSGNTNGINALENATDQTSASDTKNSDTFNAIGQKVNRSYRGIVIKNGRKSLNR